MRLPKGAQSDGPVTAPNVAVASATLELVNANSLRQYAPVATQVPAGGTTGQVLTKTSNADHTTAWSTPSVTQAKIEEIEFENWFSL